MLVTVTLNMVYVLTVAAKPLVEKPTRKCPDCGGELTCLGFVPSAPRRLAQVADQKAATIAVDLGKSSEAMPISKPSAKGNPRAKSVRRRGSCRVRSIPSNIQNCRLGLLEHGIRFWLAPFASDQRTAIDKASPRTSLERRRRI